MSQKFTFTDLRNVLDDGDSQFNVGKVIQILKPGDEVVSQDNNK